MSDFDPLERRRSLQEATDELSTDLLPVGDDGTITLGAFTLTPLGLVVRGHVSEEDWLQVGGALRRLQNSLQWLVGDWLLLGERKWGRTYDYVAGLLGWDAATLRDLSWVCDHVRISVRTDKLTFAHHRLVAALAADEQRQWLRAAEQRGWSVRALRAALNGVELPAPKRGVERLADGVLRERADAERLAKRLKHRRALIGFAAEQEAWWRGYRERLETQGE